MLTYRVDLHIHLGRAAGRPVKIPAAPNLTLENVARECLERKGLHIAGIVDMAATPARAELERLLAEGVLQPLPGGGVRYRDAITVLMGAEVETAEGNGLAHWCAFLPSPAELREFAARYERTVRNPHLSTQRSTWSGAELCRVVRGLGGFVFPAHVFTPYKGIYGACVARLAEVLPDEVLEWIPAAELGLSADTAMADRLPELDGKAFLTDSDCHSLPKLGREFNVMRLAAPTFEDVARALRESGGAKAGGASPASGNRPGILANYGLDPRLGKYHRTFCLTCEQVVPEPPPAGHCARCGGTQVVFGVTDRLEMIAERPSRGRLVNGATVQVPGRPPYHYQVPLEFIPGVGPRLRDRLIAGFGSELAALHDASGEALRQVAGEQVAGRILAARRGELALRSGGGGLYGSVMI